MLASLSIIFLFGMFIGWIFKNLRLPPLIGMIIAGIIVGPYSLNILSETMLNISADLRKIALIIILSRAGLSLDLEQLKKVGRPAIMMCFVPAAFEMAACTIISHFVLNLSYIDSAIVGAVIAAVSPAVVVPRMIKLIDGKYGSKRGIPQMIMAGASADDVFVIVMFTAFVSLSQGGNISALSFIKIPISIFLGIAIGVVFGIILCRLFSAVSVGASSKVIIYLGLSLFLTSAETYLENIIPFASLLSVMACGAIIYRLNPNDAKDMSSKFSELWVGAEILLFVLLGSVVDIKYAVASGMAVISVIILSLIFRMLGVQTCLIKTSLNRKERLFTSLSYIPKATVQAAIGSVPLSMGLSCGKTVLTVAVTAIILTAPIGAILIDKTYKVLLKKD